jgi:hypothetical protein
VALSDTSTSTVELLAFISLTRRFAPSFTALLTKKTTVTLDQTQLNSVMPGAFVEIADDMFASVPGYYLETLPAQGFGSLWFIVGNSGVGALQPPYALIAELQNHHLGNPDFVSNFSAPEPTNRFLERPAVERLRTSVITDTFAIAAGWPAVYGDWMTSLRLPLQ